MDEEEPKFDDDGEEDMEDMKRKLQEMEVKRLQTESDGSADWSADSMRILRTALVGRVCYCSPSRRCIGAFFFFGSEGGV
jgi:hypothetical protein